MSRLSGPSRSSSPMPATARCVASTSSSWRGRDATGGVAVNGEPIQIAEDGTLLNGQHRLNAVIESGATVPMLVVRGLPKRRDDDGRGSATEPLRRSRPPRRARHDEPGGDAGNAVPLSQRAADRQQRPPPQTPPRRLPCWKTSRRSRPGFRWGAGLERDRPAGQRDRSAHLPIRGGGPRGGRAVLRGGVRAGGPPTRKPDPSSAVDPRIGRGTNGPTSQPATFSSQW